MTYDIQPTSDGRWAICRNREIIGIFPKLSFCHDAVKRLREIHRIGSKLNKEVPIKPQTQVTLEVKDKETT